MPYILIMLVIIGVMLTALSFQLRQIARHLEDLKRQAFINYVDHEGMKAAVTDGIQAMMTRERRGDYGSRSL